MCRHLMPHLDFHIGQTLHGIGALMVAHPTSTATAILIPSCTAFTILAFQRLTWPAPAWRKVIRTGPSSCLPVAVGDVFETFRSV